jgi:hypothetical protein
LEDIERNIHVFWQRKQKKKKKQGVGGEKKETS